jgi:Arc/MetJ family transcription regulator
MQGGLPMRTTLDLPDGLLAAAQRACGAKTKAMTVVMALQQLVNAAKIEELRGLRGKVRFDVDLKALRSERVAGRWPARRR